MEHITYSQTVKSSQNSNLLITSAEAGEDKSAGLGHNSQTTIDQAVAQNMQTGVFLLVKEALVTAIQDRRLGRSHLRVLAAMAMHINSTSAKAWPSRRVIADMLGIAPVTVSNKIRELRKMGYLISGRERVEAAGNRSLTVYTFGNIDHDTIRREVTHFVTKMREQRKPKVTQVGDSQTSRVTQPGDIHSILPQSEVTQSGDSQAESHLYRLPKVTCTGCRKSPVQVDSNSMKELSYVTQEELPNGNLSFPLESDTDRSKASGKKSKPKRKAKPKPPKIDIDVVVVFNSYNTMALELGLPQAVSLTPSRRQRISARLREHGGMSAWWKALDLIKKSKFLQGQNNRGWRCNFDFLCQASSFAKIIDGAYSSSDRSGVETQAQRLARWAKEVS